MANYLNWKLRYKDLWIKVRLSYLYFTNKEKSRRRGVMLLPRGLVQCGTERKIGIDIIRLKCTFYCIFISVHTVLHKYIKGRRKPKYSQKFHLNDNFNESNILENCEMNCHIWFCIHRAFDHVIQQTWLHFLFIFSLWYIKIV